LDALSPFEPTVLGAIWKYRFVATLIVVATTSLAIAYAILSPVSYQATANLVVEDPAATALFDIGRVQSPQRYVADQAAILRSTVVADRAAAAEPALPNPEAVVDGLDVFWDVESDLIQASFISDDADTAVKGANAVIDAYTEVVAERISGSFAAASVQLEDSIAEVETQLVRLQQEIQLQIQGDPSLASLDGQLAEALTRLIALQGELPGASESRLPDLRSELDDILQQIQTLQTLIGLESQRPELAVLLEEQRQTIFRKSELLGRMDELSVEARMESSGIALADPAIFAREVGADARRTTAVGLMIGALIAAGTTYLLALRRRTFSDRAQPELILHAPLLAEVPNFRSERIVGELPVKDYPESVSAEAFRFISAAIDIETEQRSASDEGAPLFADRTSPPVRTFVVVSPDVGDGKTVIAANTALAVARQGKRVLLVDADFGNQKLSQMIGGIETPEAGLTDLVERGVPFARIVNRVPLAAGATIDLVTRGLVRVTAPDFFRSEGVKTFFEAVKDEYDLVLIDTPPMLHVAYASPIIRYADRVLVVTNHDGKVSTVEDIADRLSLLETEIVGYVYNKAPLRDDMTRSEGSLKDVLGRSFQLPPVGR
jgi:Mrp family chromosome partitioning ATPase